MMGTFAGVSMKRRAIPENLRQRGHFFLLCCFSIFLVSAAALPAAELGGNGEEGGEVPVLIDPSVQGVPGTSLPTSEELVAAGARIGEVKIRIGNVFDTADPKDNKRIFHLINRLHILTRPHIVAEQLLFAQGGLYDPEHLAESERLLRKARFFYDVHISPSAYDHEKNLVDILVDLRDVWTLKLGAKVGRSGGNTDYGFGLEDDNFLGTGKGIRLDRRKNVDRTSTVFHYVDPALAGSRWRLEAQAENNSDGNVYFGDLELPFFALDSRRAFGVQLGIEELEVPLYERSEIRDRFARRREHAQLYYGYSPGLRGKRVWRWLAGVGYEDITFTALPEETVGALPAPRHLIYPFLGVSTVADRFAKTRDFDQIARTEDLQLGLSATFTLGFASESLGSDRDALILNGLAKGGFEIGKRQILLYELGLSGRIGRDGNEDLRLSGSLSYHRRNFGRHLLVLEARGEVADNLDGDHQLLLGGDNGLRGYPLRYQSGKALLLFTAEQRFYTDWYPFRLVNVGGAAFFDVGRTFSDEAFAGNRGWLTDIGLGLRLSSSRTHHGNVIHLDLAFPLNADPNIKSVQWLVRTRASF